MLSTAALPQEAFLMSSAAEHGIQTPAATGTEESPVVKTSASAPIVSAATPSTIPPGDPSAGGEAMPPGEPSTAAAAAPANLPTAAGGAAAGGAAAGGAAAPNGVRGNGRGSGAGGGRGKGKGAGRGGGRLKETSCWGPRPEQILATTRGASGLPEEVYGGVVLPERMLPVPQPLACTHVFVLPAACPRDMSLTRVPPNRMRV